MNPDPPIDISPMLAEIQVSFTRLERLAPTEGPWSWQHPTLRRWMEQNGFQSHNQLLDNPAATHIVLQSLRAKIRKTQDQVEQLDLPIVTSPHWGAWVDPSTEVSHG
ncbi:hypothetical protein [Pseudanabaena sp. FACHB-2040]|uniref:hypothetical protein n=1 Tax=Pseudanabaena sp. FACHB-2040 TaxID=2692859 RepID=UPI0016841F3D|nr:hypothetical protein [Pseudanabaena sp. FACHB-2040]MBD2259897.1 hypothetical protein [Pseudanabaena sp. FACHB-2040]